LGERWLCKPEVVGSIPISSTNKFTFDDPFWAVEPQVRLHRSLKIQTSERCQLDIFVDRIVT
jgi:hypothetical protein